MFDNIKSIKRILCPIFNNFKKYDSVINSVAKNENIIFHAFILKIKTIATLLFYDLFWFEY